MIVIETYKGKSITEHRVEVVERKGIGHPDYMCILTPLIKRE